MGEPVALARGTKQQVAAWHDKQEVQMYDTADKHITYTVTLMHSEMPLMTTHSRNVHETCGCVCAKQTHVDSALKQSEEQHIHQDSALPLISVPGALLPLPLPPTCSKPVSVQHRQMQEA